MLDGDLLYLLAAEQHWLPVARSRLNLGMPESNSSNYRKKKLFAVGDRGFRDGQSLDVFSAHAVAEGVPVAVKLVKNPWTIERLPWLSTTIDRLQASGYPTPRVLWHAPLRTSQALTRA